MNGLVCCASAAVTHAENSDVLSPKASVAVDVTASPPETGAERPDPVSSASTPPESALPSEKPMKVAPSPKPEGSHVGDAKYSTRYPRPALLVSVPLIRTLPFGSNDARVSTGELWLRFAPLTRAMPLPPLLS